MNLSDLLAIAKFSPRFLQHPAVGLGHVALTAWMIQEISPKIFVELGQQGGNLYFACCQSVVENNLPTKCYAVDLIDNKNSSNSDVLFATAKAHNETYYAGFSQLMRMSSDEAFTYFADDSISLLVINLSAYEAVSNHFETWLPKLASGAVVMVSDTCQTEDGVGKLWKEFQARYPNNLEFVHANGLGVLQLDNAPKDKLLDWLQPNSIEKQQVITYFTALDSLQIELATLKAQVAERDLEIETLKTALNLRNLAGAESDQALAGRDAHIIALNKIIEKLNKELKHVVYSKSWELTKPLRVIRRMLNTGQLDFSDGYTLPDFTDDPVLNVANPSSLATQLKPNLHYGAAYQEAARMALMRSEELVNPPKLKDNRVVAVVIHAFYEAILDEILGYLDKIQSISLKLYVTTPIEQFEVVNRKLQLQKHGFYVLPVSNRGRDILPFLKIMPEVLKGGHDMLIKVHTKKSVHREDGDLWRKDVFDKLLSEQAFKANIDYLIANPEVGILGPTGHIVPMDAYAGSNMARVAQLAARKGVDSDTVKNLNFVAGSMFLARTKAFIPLLNIALSETDFEAEANQLDGTLAHTLERMFPVSAFSVGLTTRSPDNSVTENYTYTTKSEKMAQSSDLAGNK